MKLIWFNIYIYLGKWYRSDWLQAPSIDPNGELVGRIEVIVLGDPCTALPMPLRPEHLGRCLCWMLSRHCQHLARTDGRLLDLYYFVYIYTYTVLGPGKKDIAGCWHCGTMHPARLKPFFRSIDVGFKSQMRSIVSVDIASSQPADEMPKTNSH